MQSYKNYLKEKKEFWSRLGGKPKVKALKNKMKTYYLSESEQKAKTKNWPRAKHRTKAEWRQFLGE